MAKVRQHDGDLYVSGNLRVLGGIQNVKNSETVTRVATSEAAIATVEATVVEQTEQLTEISGELAEIHDPNQLTTQLKRGAQIQWEAVVELNTAILAAMTKVGLPTSNQTYLNYDSVYDSLYAYLFTNPACLADLTTTTTINYVTFASLWKAEVEKREALSTLIQSWGYLHGTEDAAASATRIPVPPVVTANIMFNTAYLRWPIQAGLTGEVTHRIERSDASNFATHTDVATIFGNAYTEEGLALNGTDDAPTSRTYYYRVVRIVNGTVESSPSTVISVVAASLSPKAIAASAINAAKLASGAVADMTKFASTIRPPRVVATVPTDFTPYVAGDTVVCTGDNKLYRFTGTAFVSSVPTGDLTGTVAGSQIAQEAIDMTKMAASIRPPRVLDGPSLPGTPWTGYTTGDLVVLTSDGLLYRFTGSGWSGAVVNIDNLPGQISSSQIENSAVGMNQIASGAVTAEKMLSNRHYIS